MAVYSLRISFDHICNSYHCISCKFRVPAIGEIGIREFLFGTTWASTAKNPEYGILPFILSSVYGTFGAILIGVPFGVLCAVFLAKSSSRKASSVFSSVIELMSGIPSVVYGLVGMT